MANFQKKNLNIVSPIICVCTADLLAMSGTPALLKNWEKANHRCRCPMSCGADQGNLAIVSANQVEL
jgi:hypothetical protein